MNANYSCSPGANGGVLKPGASGCSGTVPNGSPIDTTTYGAHTFTVTATDTDGQTTTTTHNYTLNYNQPIPTPTRPQRPLGTVIVNPRVDIRVTGIEVTQGVQANTCNCAGTLPNRLDPFANTPGRATYEGVTMAAGKYTIVRVFAHFTPVDVPSATSLRGATAQLRIFDAHEREISPPLSPDISPSTLSRPDCVACVSESERASPRAAFTFVVPTDETYHRSLSFRATVSPPIGLGAVVQCGGCNANVFTLRGVPFATTANVEIYPIPLTVGGVQTSKTEDQVFDSTQTALPVNVDIHPYDAPLAVDGLNATQATAAVDGRALDELRVNSQYPVGVFTAGGLNNSGGLTIGGRYLFARSNVFWRAQFGLDPPISVVADNRPLTSVMHEIGHGLGLVHADTGYDTGAAGAARFSGQHPDGTGDCGGNSGGQVGEAWPPDNEGRIQGVGLDLRAWTLRILEENHPGLGSTYYDFMSYCPGSGGTIQGTVQQFEADHWVSVRNWSRLIAFHPPAQALPTAVDASTASAHVAAVPPLRVIATVDSAGTASLFDVASGERTFADPTPGSPYRFELRNAAGATLASVVPATTSVHNDGARPGLVLEATLPLAPSAAAVVLSAGGVELTRRTRSAHAPTVKLVSPRPGARIGRSSRTLVRWRAHDADGDRLTTTVDYSADGGRHWKVVASTKGGDSTRVPSRLLSTSHNARIRIRVSDGFDVASATSGLLRAAGSRPVVHIIGGPPGGRMRADRTLFLRGEAFDDSGRPISGRRLAWYDGRRLLGHGKLLTARNLPTGNSGIRLVATDTLGRSTRVVRPLRVLAPPPTFLVARAPSRVAPKARRVRIVVASTVPATLAIGRKRYAVNRKPRAITISIRRGRSILRLPYVLSGRGGALRGTYLALR